MAINRSRLRDYLKELRSLQKRVGDTQFVERFTAKMLDALARGLLDTTDITFLRKEVERLFTIDFSSFDIQILRTYNDVIDLVNEQYPDIGADVSREFERLRAVEEINRLQLGNYKQKTIDAIARAVRQGIIDDDDVKALEARIFSLGDKASIYAKTLAQTQIKRYGRVGKYHKALVSGVEYFEYAGILRETTRPFCHACLHGIFHINDLLNMRNGNLEPVIINCGGWNCIHDLEPDPTATAQDAREGRMIALKQGVKIFGDEGTRKRFIYSQGYERIAKQIKEYVQKCRQAKLADARLEKIRSDHYPDLNERQLRAKAGYIRNNPERVYYSYQDGRGPRIVFEFGGEFVFLNTRELKTMYKPADYDKHFEGFVQYLIDITEEL